MKVEYKSEQMNYKTFQFDNETHKSITNVDL